MMENTTDYVYFKDANHVFTGASKTLLALCKSVHKWTDFLGKTDYDVFPEEYADIYYSLEKQIYSNTPIAKEIQKTLTVDGVEGWVDNRKFPVHNDNGEIIGLFGIARDITKLKQTQDELHQMKKLIDTALNTQADTFFLFDAATGKPIRWNNAFRDISGYSDEEIAVLPAPASYYSPADLKHFESIMQKVFKGEKSTFEMELICKDGHKVLTEYSLSAVVDKKGNPEYIISIGRDIRKRKQAEEVVWHSANFDRLTDLPNRSLFFDRLSKVLLKSKRNNQYAAVLFLDLDGFKEANDIYGHEAGDHVLVTVAERWLKSIRDVDTLARMGGDEFAVIIDGLPTPDTADIVAKKLIDALALDIQLSSNQKCNIGVSIGISVYPQNATEMDTLLATADVAMYESKSNGKNTFTFSSADPFSANNPREWIILDDDHLVGWHDIDDEHIEIVRLVNHLNYAILEGADNDAIGHLFEELANYTVSHFEHEHKLMEASSYPEMHKHDLVHKALIAQVQRLAQEVQKGNGLFLLQTIKDWLLKHVVYYDKPLAVFLNEQKSKK
ncbi:MAG: bacteriohemerythrin, partial [Mariprofundaceae bacterium]|nr:bacteriohemerythrin [Mariprofundaceae bacterium]